MNAVSQANELPKLAKQLIGYKPHSRIMPRCEAVKLWRELLKAVEDDGSVEGSCIIVDDGHFHFIAKGNRTIVRWVKHVSKEEYDQEEEVEQ
jgi:hypothetical protein